MTATRSAIFSGRINDQSVEDYNLIARKIFNVVTSQPKKIADYQMVQLIGIGGHSVVFRAKSLGRNSKEHIAIKAQEPAPGYIQPKEFRLLKNLDHQNVIKVLEVKHRGPVCFIFMELGQLGNLKDFTHRRGEVPRTDIASLYSQCVDAVQYLHGKGIVHRDIKASNFVLTKSRIVKLVDFGSFFQVRNGDSRQEAGTRAYMSPELLAGKPASKASDCWALGVLLHFLVVRSLPWNEASRSDVEFHSFWTQYVVSPQPSINENTILPLLPFSVFVQLMDVNRYKRLNADQVTATDWYRLGQMDMEYQLRRKRGLYFVDFARVQNNFCEKPSFRAVTKKLSKA